MKDHKIKRKLKNLQKNERGDKKHAFSFTRPNSFSPNFLRFTSLFYM